MHLIIAIILVLFLIGLMFTNTANNPFLTAIKRGALVILIIAIGIVGFLAFKVSKSKPTDNYPLTESALFGEWQNSSGHIYSISREKFIIKITKSNNGKILYTNSGLLDDSRIGIGFSSNESGKVSSDGHLRLQTSEKDGYYLFGTLKEEGQKKFVHLTKKN